MSTSRTSSGATTASIFPHDPYEQLRLATEAVFKSWNGKRAIDYRNAAKIPHDLGTAVNIQTMVFGNMGEDSATGVAMTRNATTGEKKIEGDYLINAQGEDVVAGIRITDPVENMAQTLPDAWKQFVGITQKLEKHYRDMQDIEFTVERGTLWMLQTRDGKRTAQAAVRIAVEMAEEGLITREEAVLRVTHEQVDFFLHPQFNAESKKAAKAEGRLLASGLNVSPGAAVGMVAFDANLAEGLGQERREKGGHGPARDQAGRCARHVGRRRYSHQPRWPDQPCRAAWPANSASQPWSGSRPWRST